MGKLMKNKAVLLLAATFLILQADFLFFLIMENHIYAAFGIPPLIWLIGGIFLWKQLKKNNLEYAFYEEGNFSSKDYLIFFFTLMGSVAFALSTYLYGGVKPLLFREYFSGYALYTIRNLIYYPLEVLLMLELVVCGQKAGEIFAKNKDIPFGAVVLCVLWGMPHMIVHSWQDGTISTFRAFVYAAPFYVSGRKFKTSYISMLILWMLC